MDLDDMTIGEAKQLAKMFGGGSTDACPFKPGDAYLIRTVTMAWTGRVREVVGRFLILDKAAWVADMGRYSDATTPEALSEVEPAGDGIFIGLGAVVDARPWLAKDLPETVK